jgi:hypothetical protein
MILDRLFPGSNGSHGNSFSWFMLKVFHGWSESLDSLESLEQRIFEQN